MRNCVCDLLWWRVTMRSYDSSAPPLTSHYLWDVSPLAKSVNWNTSVEFLRAQVASLVWVCGSKAFYKAAVVAA